MASSSRKRSKQAMVYFWPPGKGNIPHFDFENYYEAIRGYPIIAGRTVDFRKFHYHGFQHHAEALGWSNFLSYENEHYPTLIPFFYANLKPIDENEEMFATLVKGKEITISEDYLAQKFSLPQEGPRIDNSTINQIFRNPDLSTIYLPGKVGTMNHNDLIDCAKMIHRVICYNIVPKAGNFDRVTEVAQTVIYCFINEEPFNLADLIFRRMIDLREHLPFGMLITAILQDFNVTLLGEPTGERGQTFGHKTLSLMKIPLLHHAPQYPPRPPAPPQQPQYSFESLHEDIQGVKESQTKMYEEIQEVKKGQSKSSKMLKKMMRKMNISSSSSDE